MDYKQAAAEVVIKAIEGSYGELYDINEILELFESPPDETLGDIALPCFRLAKRLRKSPQMIAQGIELAFASPLMKAISVNGYLNISYNRERFASDIVANVLERGDEYGSSSEGGGKTICIDYSSVNIAKRFHIGHLSTTMIGHSLKRIFDFLGYKTVGINHLGDWGTQFGVMINAYKHWGSKEEIERGGLDAITKLYVRHSSEEKDNPALRDEARAWFLRIEQGEPEATQIFEWFKEITMKEVGRVYDMLGVSFDSYKGESFYNDKMQPIIDRLAAMGLLVKSEGASIVDLSDCDMPPCLILRSDGATLYATRDLAAAVYRKETYDFHECLYVTAYQQDLHFKQVFKVLEKMGYHWSSGLKHISYGMVSYEGRAMATREGHVVYLEDVLSRATDKALAIMEEKSPNLEDKQSAARMVGVGAVVYAILSAGRIKDVDFWWDRALNFDGETGPYVQYAYARCRSLLAKAPTYDRAGSIDGSHIADDDALRVVRLLERFGSVVADAARKYEPSIITHYVTKLAQAYNKYYFEHRILEGGDEAIRAKVALTEAAAIVIRRALFLIGVDAPERM